MITITSFFTDNGTPKTGLAPTISIRRADTHALVVTWDTMTEVGDGWYKYNFNGDETLDYLVVCDGGTALTTAERYTFGGSDINPHLINMNDKVNRILGLSQENYKIINPVYDDQNNLSAGTIKIYPSAADLDADTNAIASYQIIATHDANGLVTEYKVKKL